MGCRVVPALSPALHEPGRMLIQAPLLLWEVLVQLPLFVKQIRALQEGWEPGRRLEYDASGPGEVHVRLPPLVEQIRALQEGRRKREGCINRVFSSRHAVPVCTLKKS